MNVRDERTKKYCASSSPNQMEPTTSNQRPRHLGPAQGNKTTAASSNLDPPTSEIHSSSRSSSSPNSVRGRRRPACRNIAQGSQG